MESTSKQLSSLYLRIKKSKLKDGKPACCPDWRNNPGHFRKWYERKLREQQSLCHYCGLPADTNCCYGKYFRKGRRGRSLEVDRKNSGGKYSAKNCVLACYPCNNAKSDVFSYEEFVKIGKAICEAKTGSV